MNVQPSLQEITYKQKTSLIANQKIGLATRMRKDFILNKYAYLMILPVIAFYLVFAYLPMYGAVIAFKDFSPSKGILGSEWVGFKHFYDFFTSKYFGRTVGNTLHISIATLVFSFPAPIILALLINELRINWFKRCVQTISYFPHFISLVVVCGMIKDFTLDTGLINDIIAFFGGERVTLLNQPSLFVPIYVISDIWQSVGWGSIIYLAALTGIDQQLYEAGRIDGAGKWKLMLHITLPGIVPTIITMLILRIGNIMSVGYEKIILLYNPMTYRTADVISSYVYRMGLQNMDFSFSTAVGLFNSVINFVLLMFSNFLSRRMNGNSLW